MCVRVCVRACAAYQYLVTINNSKLAFVSLFTHRRRQGKKVQRMKVREQEREKERERERERREVKERERREAREKVARRRKMMPMWRMRNRLQNQKRNHSAT